MIDSMTKSSPSGMDLFTGALELIRDAIVIVDSGGRILFLNRMAETLCGWRSYEAIGRPVTSVLKMVHADTHQVIEDPVKSLLQESQSPTLRGKLVLLSKDNTEFPISDGGSAPRTKGGRLTAVYLIFRQWVDSAIQMDDNKAILTSHMEAIGALAGGIAHDFNNVLTAVVGNLSLARMHLTDPEKTRGRLEQAERASLRARDISRQLLTFAKGGAPIKTATCIGEPIKATASQALHETTVRCEFEIPDDLWPAEVDIGQFNLAIRNLVTYSAQSTQTHGKIEVSAANVTLTRGMIPGLRPGIYVRVSVRDYGQGIAPQHLARIFEPYFITRKTGSGLGLATAYSVIRRHEGTITAESIIDRGSTFHIFVPASQKAPEREEPPTEKLTHRGAGRILIMDDEADVRLVATDMLELMGYEVDTTPDGAQALQLYNTAKRIGKPYAAVIFDLTVPAGMGGKEAIVKLREIDPGAKAIVSSGYSYDPVMANFQEHGFDAVVPKPYKPEELARTLKNLLAIKQHRELESY
ncbi:MAG TPA: hypothetical protein DCY13_07540 [Verrucomicrobiales bacterium]|nr:hypothetical protein [Verrucomicrobiales bacterium]